MNLKTKLLLLFTLTALLITSVVSAEQTEPTEKTEPKAISPKADAAVDKTQEKKSYGINIDMGLATIYNFRGWNVFQDTSQQDHNGAFFPGITWSIANSGVYAGYWGAYQVSGSNQKTVIDNALGHEQDLYVGYDKELADGLLTLSAKFTYGFYPFSNIDGSNNPSIIEPLVAIGLSKVFDFSLGVSYFAGLDDVTKSSSYLYINPAVAKSLSLGKYVGFDLALRFGYKVWSDSDVRDVNNNAVDLSFDFTVPVSIPGGLYLAPAIHSAWTNIDRMDNPDGTTRKATVGDEFMIYGSINIGADF